MQEENEQEHDTYQLALCEIHHSLLHGAGPVKNDKSINNHFLIYTTFSPDEFYNNNYKSEEKYFQRYRQAQYQRMYLQYTHPGLRNYTQKYNRLEIVKYHILTVGDSRYHIAYLKTFWLRIVQRCWKKVYKTRQEILKGRSSIKALVERMTTGSWPKHLQTWPQFKLKLLN